MSSTPGVLRLPASLTHQFASAVTAEAAKTIAAAAGASAAAVTVDASALAQFDSSALAVVLDCRRQALAAGRPFEVTGMSARLTQLAKLYGVAELIQPSAVQAQHAS
jgi:phospholipid transport system transporter-binding protein